MGGATREDGNGCALVASTESLAREESRRLLGRGHSLRARSHEVRRRRQVSPALIGLAFVFSDGLVGWLHQAEACCAWAGVGVGVGGFFCVRLAVLGRPGATRGARAVQRKQRASVQSANDFQCVAPFKRSEFRLSTHRSALHFE
jgi:hypothetical protein